MAPYKHQVRSPFWLRVLSCTPFEADSTSASTTETDLGISDRHLLVARWDKGTTLQALPVSFSSLYSHLLYCSPLFLLCLFPLPSQLCRLLFGFSSRVVFKMADSNNTALTKRTGAFFYSWTCCEDACAHTRAHTQARSKEVLWCVSMTESSFCLSPTADRNQLMKQEFNPTAPH